MGASTTRWCWSSPRWKSCRRCLPPRRLAWRCPAGSRPKETKSLPPATTPGESGAKTVWVTGVPTACERAVLDRDPAAHTYIHVSESTDMHTCIRKSARWSNHAVLSDRPYTSYGGHRPDDCRNTKAKMVMCSPATPSSSENRVQNKNKNNPNTPPMCPCIAKQKRFTYIHTVRLRRRLLFSGLCGATRRPSSTPTACPPAKPPKTAKETRRAPRARCRPTTKSPSPTTAAAT